MKTLISILISLVLLAGCAVQKEKLTPAEKQKLREAVIRRLYIEWRLKEDEKEFGVEPNDLEQGAKQ